MSLQRPIATSFNGGELSPRMGGRVDTAIYGVGLEQAENFVPTVEGAIVKRPGFEYIRPAAPTASWLTQFRFNLTQDYVIEWSDGKLRFYTNDVRIETAPGVAYEVAVPYSAAEAPFVSCQQSFDRLYMDHAGHPPARLTRTSATTFVYEVLPFQNGPFADRNRDQAVTVTASAATGSVTISASAAIFLPGHVGAPFQIEAADFSTIPAWEAQTKDIKVGDVRRSEGKAYTAETAGITGTVVLTHTTGAEWDGSNTKDANDKGPFGVRWAYRHDRFGMLVIDTVASDGRSATATVTRRLPDSVVTVPTWRWTHGAFSAAAGWPSVVIAWAGRLCHFKQFELLASVAGDYPNHSVSTLGGDQNLNIVSESGMYAAIFKSRREEAERFRKWVTATVLPSIRKTGRFELAGYDPPPLAPIDLDPIRLNAGVATVREARRLFGNEAARSIWTQVGLPAPIVDSVAQYSGDSWAEPVKAWLADRTEATAVEAARGIGLREIDRQATTRIAALFRLLGWLRLEAKRGGVKQNVWFHPDHAPEKAR